MGLVFSETTSGLSAAFMASDEASVRAALKQHDRDLNLEWKRVDGTHIWYVTKYLGSERRDEWICDWELNGEPLPLSHGLVQRIKDLDLNSRAPIVDPEQLNDAMIEEAREEFGEAIDDISADIIERIRGRKLHALPRGAYRRNTRFKDIRR